MSKLVTYSLQVSVLVFEFIWRFRILNTDFQSRQYMSIKKTGTTQSLWLLFLPTVWCLDKMITCQDEDEEWMENMSEKEKTIYVWGAVKENVEKEDWKVRGGR